MLTSKHTRAAFQLTLALAFFLPSLAFCQGNPVPYKSQIGKTITLIPWQGRRAAVLNQNAKRDPRIMKILVRALDKAYMVYEQITGSAPGPNSGATLDGLDIVAEVPDADTACGGAACSYLGSLGSEIGTTYFDQLYDGIRSHGEYDQAMFYEFGRTFWFYQDQLGKIDPFVTGFAIANRFISLDRANLKGGPFGKLSYSEFKRSILVDLLDSYLENPNLTWRNSLLVEKPPPNQYGWSAADLQRGLAPRGGFEPPTFRLTAEMNKNLSALSGVAYEKLGAIFPFLVAPTPAPKEYSESTHNITAMPHNAVPG